MTIGEFYVSTRGNDANPGTLGSIAPSVYEFGTIEKNALYSTHDAKDVFVDPENGDYTVADMERVREHSPDFENIPLADIGRNRA